MPITMSSPENKFAQHFYKLIIEMNKLGLLSKNGKELEIPHKLYVESDGEE